MDRGSYELLPVGIAGLSRGWQVASVNVGSAAAIQLDAVPLANRRSVAIYNNSAVVIYVGPTNAVTSLSGFPIPVGYTLHIDLASDVDIWARAASGVTNNVRFMELS